MPRAISNVRVASDVITHEGGTTPTEREIDFDLGLNEAIEIFGIVGLVNSFATYTVGTSPGADSGVQALQLDPDNPRDIAHLTSDTDITFLDEEAIFMQAVQAIGFNDTTNGTGGLATTVTPNGLVTYPEQILSAINPSHTIVTNGADLDFVGTLMIHYRYVQLTQQEIAFQVARRR